MHKLTNNLCL